MKRNNILVLLFLSVLFIGCPEEGIYYDGKITLINNSENGIVWYSYSSNPMDTSLMGNLPWYKPKNFLILSGDTCIDLFEIELMRNVLSNGFKHYYIFDYDSIKAIPWERIRDEYIVAKRVDFDTWEELEDCDFTITYP